MTADGKLGIVSQRTVMQPDTEQEYWFLSVSSRAADLIAHLGGEVKKVQGGAGWAVRFPQGTQVDMVTSRVPGPGMVNPGVTIPARWLVTGSYKGDVWYPDIREYNQVVVPPTWIYWEYDANHQGKILLLGEQE